MTLRRCVAILVALLAGLVLLPSGPATAVGSAIYDENSPGQPDLRRIWVNNFHPDRIRFTVRYDGRMAEYTRIYVDTDPRDAGPEYLVAQDVDAAGAQRRFGVYRVERWGQEPRAGHDTCASLPARVARRENGQSVGYLVPRSCLGGPGYVRVGVHVFSYEGTNDWAPAPRRFSRPVPQG